MSVNYRLILVALLQARCRPSQETISNITMWQ